MTRFRARGKYSLKVIEVEFDTLEEAMHQNQGYTDWRPIPHED